MSQIFKSQQTMDKYVRWAIHHVRDEVLRRVGNMFRANYITDPDDPLHRGPYHRLLRAGVPEAAIPAVLEQMIWSVELALELAAWQVDQLLTTGHLRASLLEAASGDEPEHWVEMSPQNLIWENFIPWSEESAAIRTPEDLDAVVRGPSTEGGTWDCPAGGCSACRRARTGPELDGPPSQDTE